MKHAIAIALVLTGALFLYGQVVDARIYKWVDENGVTRFSDTPPPGMIADIPPENDPPTEKKTGPPGPDGSGLKVAFDLSGEVRDAGGNPVNGVTLTIVENHPRPDTLGFKQVRKKQTVNGRFSIVCSGCPIHKLRFRAPGYLSEVYRIKATPAEEQRIARQFAATAYGMDSPGAKDPITIRRSGIVITLQSEKSVVRLIRLSAQLMTGEGEPLKVLSGPGSELRSHLYRLALEKQAAAGKAHAVIALSTGSMPFIFFQSAGEKNSLHLMDTPLYLELKDAAGGFVVADPGRGAFRKRFDALTEAPASGYLAQLPVGPSNSDGVFFYCKIGDFYGKGHVYAPTYMTIRGRPLLRTHVEIYMNPTGSKNLKSRI